MSLAKVALLSVACLSVLVAYGAYRLYKKITRRCEYCGSIFKVDRFPRNIRVGWNEWQCEIIKICHNNKCPHKGEEVCEKAFPRIFNSFELFWRQIWHEFMG